jgi:DNA-binding XRE family transcriptional regulator
MIDVAPQDPHDRLLLSLSEAAELAGVARKTMHFAEKRGEVEALHTALGRLFRRDSVEAWKLSRRARSWLRTTAEETV